MVEMTVMLLYPRTHTTGVEESLCADSMSSPTTTLLTTHAE